MIIRCLPVSRPFSNSSLHQLQHLQMAPALYKFPKVASCSHLSHWMMIQLQSLHPTDQVPTSKFVKTRTGILTHSHFQTVPIPKVSKKSSGSPHVRFAYNKVVGFSLSFYDLFRPVILSFPRFGHSLKTSQSSPFLAPNPA